MSDDFVDHLERQLKTDTDLLTSTPENKHASVAESFDTPENNFIDNSGEKSIGKTSPITFFIDEQIKEGEQVWQEAWIKLNNMADMKNTKTENLTLHNFGEKDVYLRRKMKQTSNKIDHAIVYYEDGALTTKTVTRQDFGRMFRDALKKCRSRSETPQ